MSNLLLRFSLKLSLSVILGQKFASPPTRDDRSSA
jgi:hypothetical protein